MPIIISQIIAATLGYALGIVISIRNKTEKSKLATYFVYADILLSTEILVYTTGLIFRSDYTYFHAASKLVLGFAISYAYRMAYAMKTDPKGIMDKLFIYSPIFVFIINGLIILQYPALHTNDVFLITNGKIPSYFTAIANLLFGTVIVGILISYFIRFKKVDPQAAWKPFFIALGLFILVVLESLPDLFTKNIVVGVVGNLGYFIGYSIVSIKLFEKTPTNVENKPLQQMDGTITSVPGF